MSQHILTRDFNAAGQKHAGDTAYLQALVQTLEGATFLDSIPFYQPDEWSQRISDNCTAFAFNLDAAGSLQPGFLGTGIARYNDNRPSGAENYSADIHESLANDNAVYLGNDLSACVEKGIPAALFFRSCSDGEDYHWYALRRTFNPVSKKDDKLLWAEKLGWFVSNDESESIFVKARRDRYEMFGGYYAIPTHLMGLRDKEIETSDLETAGFLLDTRPD